MTSQILNDEAEMVLSNATNVLNKNTILIEKIIWLMQKKIESLNLIYLFGSFASGQNTLLSDIDIGIMANSKLAPIERWQLENELANELNHEVDLVDLLNTSTVMQNQIINHGICIFEHNHKAAEFEMQVTSMYQHFNEERKAILTDYIN